MEVLKTRPSLTSLIKSVSEEQGIEDHIIIDVKTNQKGEGYLGEIFMITVKDANTGKHLEMVIKAAFSDAKVREMVPIRMSFENEIKFYTNIFPTFENLDEEHGMSKKVQLVPKCLKVYVKDPEEVLVLENLKSIGYEIFEKTEVLDEDHVELIFKTYGRYHAYSFVLRDQRPEEFTTLTKNLYNIYDEFMKKGYFGHYLMETSKVVQTTFIPGEDDEIIKKYEKYTGQSVADMFQDIITEEVEYSGILHGDGWSNNMMFKYEDTASDGRKPVDMRLIDMQLVRVGSPVCDLSYCLYSGASKKIFDNLNDYLRIYHDSFSSCVRELGSDPEKLFPFSVLQEQWKKYSKFGMIMAFSILKMKLTIKEDIIDLTDMNNFDTDDLTQITEAFTKQRFDQESYNKRIRGLLWHMLELDAL